MRRQDLQGARFQMPSVLNGRTVKPRAQCDAGMAWHQQDKTSDRRKVWISWLEQLAHDQRVAQMGARSGIAGAMPHLG